MENLIISSTRINGLSNGYKPKVTSRIQKPDSHAWNVAALAAILARKLDCNANHICRIYLGAFLHDAGKRFIPNKILDKTQPLTKAEFAVVQHHPVLGYLHLNQFMSDSIILNTVLHHHEHWNGTGYPSGLKHQGIPLEARICTVADVWDALVSKRCYHNAWAATEVLDYIWKGAGTLFDPEIALLFTKLMQDSQYPIAQINKFFVHTLAFMQNSEAPFKLDFPSLADGLIQRLNCAGEYQPAKSLPIRM